MYVLCQLCFFHFIFISSYFTKLSTIWLSKTQKRLIKTGADQNKNLILEDEGGAVPRCGRRWELQWL